ncbi:MAG: hypothetical protein IT577_08945 [Verrucomicrobiae bacterium]|nr:hypothetical protein [Verrucomicrobiae bacterium]
MNRTDLKHTLALLAALSLAPIDPARAADTSDAAPGAPQGGGLPVGKNATHDGRPGQLMQDPGFEACPPGTLASTGASAAWEVQRTGREAIRDRLVVACAEDEARARSGRRCLALSIPKETVGFEFVTVGQRLQLAAGKEYVASVWVRWVGGPDEPPAGASATPAHRSAIVSFWARHRDNRGAFAGRDEWLFDSRWHKLAFRFCETDPGQRTFVYVSLLPNQKPAETTVLVDDFELVAADAPAETESRSGNIVGDPGFGAQHAGGIASPWRFAGRGGTNVAANVARADGNPRVTLELAQGTSNFESGQLWQHLELRRGVRYEIGCRMRWDNFAPDIPAPIVNYGIFHEATRTWYGPVDQVLERAAGWHTYRFAHIPPVSGRWKLYVQLNGWGNFGRAVSVSFDDLTCTPAR